MGQLHAQLPITKKNMTIWLDQPQNLYLTGKQANTYLDLMRDKEYSKNFHNPLRDLLSRKKELLLENLIEPICIIDMGPGYPDKTLPLFAYLKKKKLKCCYMPVDISPKFLSVATQALQPYGFPIKPQNCLFEELPSRLSHSSFSNDRGCRLIILGLTFMNYRPLQIAKLLSKIARPRDVILLATEHVESDREEKIVSPYRTQKAEKFGFMPLEMLDVNRNKVRYFATFSRGRIEMGFKILEPIQLHGLVLYPETKVVTAISYRYTYKQFRAFLRKHFQVLNIFSDLSKRVSMATLRIKS